MALLDHPIGLMAPLDQYNKFHDSIKMRKDLAALLHLCLTLTMEFRKNRKTAQMGLIFNVNNRPELVKDPSLY